MAYKGIKIAAGKDTEVIALMQTESKKNGWFITGAVWGGKLHCTCPQANVLKELKQQLKTEGLVK